MLPRRALSLGLACALLAGCGGVPRDPEGTLDRVRQEGRFAVGLVAGASGGDGARVVARIARATHARPVIARGQLEPLLLDLEEGRLDLVVGGRFDAKTPWAMRVTLGTPLDQGVHREHVVARNGENAWIMLVERALRAEGAK